jgi:sn-glycerol 3-phosphate transport system permease protein
MVGRHPVRRIALHAVLVLGVVLMLAPVWFAFVVSTHSGSDFLTGQLAFWPGTDFLDNYRTALVDGASEAGLQPVGRLLWNSFVMAFAIAAGKIVISLISAFAITWFRFPLRSAVFWVIFITLMLPVEVRILPTFSVTASLGLLNSYAGLTVPIIASATATFLYRQVFMSVPEELTEAARIDGAGPLRFLWDMVLPLSRTNTAALFMAAPRHERARLRDRGDGHPAPGAIGRRRPPLLAPGHDDRDPGHPAAGRDRGRDAEAVRQRPRRGGEVMRTRAAAAMSVPTGALFQKGSR